MLSGDYYKLMPKLLLAAYKLESSHPKKLWERDLSFDQQKYFRSHSFSQRLYEEPQRNDLS